VRKKGSGLALVSDLDTMDRVNGVHVGFGREYPNARFPLRWERKSGFQVLVVLLGLRHERVEVFFVPLIFDYDVLVSSY
jgi:hypothetical protein